VPTLIISPVNVNSKLELIRGALWTPTRFAVELSRI